MHLVGLATLKNCDTTKQSVCVWQYIYIYIYIYCHPQTDCFVGNKKWRCPWSNGYRRRKWTRRHELKSSTRLIAFQIALIHLGKVWTQLFSLQLWANSRAATIHCQFRIFCVRVSVFLMLDSSALVRQLVGEKENSEFRPVKLRLKIDLVSYPARAEGLVNRMAIYIYIYIYIYVCMCVWLNITINL